MNVQKSFPIFLKICDLQKNKGVKNMRFSKTQIRVICIVLTASLVLTIAIGILGTLSSII